ncbi:hypothetical protein [Saccharospirillum alexandrii]|uniref:hypothetical protein n=1 Tax=Saccharospirillum alexandrii TaxID=2448477 RepID=UPI000FDBC65A|nr:hypothetical protein [Saccharospirillum alexandrii]
MSQKDTKQRINESFDPGDTKTMIKAFTNMFKHLEEKGINHRNKLLMEREERLKNETAMAAFLELWLKRETWLLHSEALAICQAYEPRHSYNQAFTHNEWAQEVKSHIEAARFNENLVINPQDKPTEWRGKPLNYIQWLKSQKLHPIKPVEDALAKLINTPDQLGQFTENQKTRNTTHHAHKREAILKAALAIATDYREQCTHNGKVSASAIARVMEEKSPLYFEDGIIPLSTEKTVKIIRDALKTTKS